MMPLLKLAKEYLELSEELQKEIKRLEDVYRKFPG